MFFFCAGNKLPADVVGGIKLEVKFIDIITCKQCAIRLERFRDMALVDFIKERNALPRCKGCSKLCQAIKKQ